MGISVIKTVHVGFGFLHILWILACICSVSCIENQTNFCPTERNYVLETPCTSCNINVFVDCPSTAMKKLTTGEGTRGCMFTRKLGPPPHVYQNGCSHNCQDVETTKQCCDGYWGPNCDECPGGAASPCFGHGTCNQTINGTGDCSCEEGFEGYACEKCSNSSMFGMNCSQVCRCMEGHGICDNSVASTGCQCLPGYVGERCETPWDVPECQNVTCPNGSSCIRIDNSTECVCDWPYEESGLGDNITCVEVKVCEVPPHCSSNATCNFDKSDPMGKNCTCLPGYHGDGYICDPIDPCQTNNGSCPADTTRCIYTEPGKSLCECLEGYHEFSFVHGCSLIDMCLENKDACHKRAVCKTVAPLEMRCNCTEGYTGDGKYCFGNILQTIEDLNSDDPGLREQLSLAMEAIETFYGPELKDHGPFTIFVPTNDAFRKLRTVNFQKWLQDRSTVQHILRQHMIIGEFPLEAMVNASIFYTLQGRPAEIQVRNRGLTYKYKLVGNGQKGRVIKKDIPASNGIVHITDTLLTNPPDARSDETYPMSRLIALNGQFNRLQSLITEAGDDIQTLIDKDNVTIFAPSNSAFDALPIGSVDHLKTDQGRQTLVSVLKNHILDTRIEVAELINLRSVKSLANTAISISITDRGQIKLNDKVSVSQTDVTARNGLLYEINLVLIPDGMSTLPNRCDFKKYKLVKGPCGDCREKTMCYSPDVATNMTTSCLYHVAGSMTPSDGCAQMCNRTYPVNKCCDGFYGMDCLPCPGGHQNPCNGNGYCNDGMLSDGACKCKVNFCGEACDRCDRDDYFGQNCSQKCTCLHGSCFNGIEGSGHCRPFSCRSGYWGEDCQKQTLVCHSGTSCHAHAICIVDTSSGVAHSSPYSLDFRCICGPGYRGDGYECSPVDPCQEPDLGGCHRQAVCRMTAPGQRSCTCALGWSGDGLYCYPGLTCANHADCHPNATCEETIPGEHICKCKDGFHGNGTQCLVTDLCLEKHGGCDPKASCVATEPGRVNCTCPVANGYSGSGFHCYGNLIKLIQDHTNLTRIAALLEKAPDYERQLLGEYNYTMFVPSDAAMAEFMNKTTAQYWQTFDAIATLLNYHTLYNSSSLESLVKLGAVYQRFDTLADGFSLHVFKDGQDVKVSARRTGSLQATVIESNILASNGYMHIIDKVIEPFLPPPEDSRPDLETFFEGNPQYSVFAQWLQDKGLTDEIEDLDAYTLFVPSNEATQSLNRTVTRDFLRYYFVPKLQMTAAADDGVTIVTDLGVDHQLVYNITGGNKAYINNVEIEWPDIFTYGGLVNGISGLLHPLLHRCAEIVQDTVRSACAPCGAETVLCRQNYSAVDTGDGIPGCTYGYRKFGRFYTGLGCYHICRANKTEDGCCSGFYGETCAECPGGPEMPCSGNGLCSDGINGTGVCRCRENARGTDCGQCVPGWAGPHCDIDMGSCRYRNGNCSANARCSRSSQGNVTCTCNLGYHGDGYNCTGPCDVANGGCHANAVCSYKVEIGVACFCRPGFVGDGRRICNGDIFSTLVAIPSAAWFVKSVQKAQTRDNVSMATRLSTESLTVFVPINIDASSSLMPLASIREQITNGSIVLTSTVTNKSNVQTLAGEPIAITIDRDTDTFYVNGVEVLERNISCVNGVLHLMARPFHFIAQSSKPPQKSGAPVAAIVGPLVAILLVILVAMVTVALYRKSSSGSWDFIHSWLPARRGSDSRQTSLIPPGEEEDFNQPTSTPGNINFGNPLYNTNDDL